MKISKASDITHDSATYLIYAQPGMGKTTALKYIKGKTLVLDIDKSSTVLAGCENIDIAEIDTHDIWDDWLLTVKELLAGAAKDYDTIVVDNISELFRNLARVLYHNKSAVASVFLRFYKNHK